MDISLLTAKNQALRGILQKLPSKLLDACRPIRLPAGQIVVLRNESGTHGDGSLS